MSFNWSDFLTLADGLANKPSIPGPEEAALRSAISRAYYAAFCQARDRATMKDGLTIQRDKSVHKSVARHYELSADLTRRDIGTRLARLRAARNNADYDKSVRGNLSSKAKQSVIDAQEILTLLGAL